MQSFFTRIALVSAVMLSLCLNTSFGQGFDSLFIVGPTDICLSGIQEDCFTYSAQGITNPGNQFYIWVVHYPDGTTQEFENESLFLCFYIPGTHLIEVYDFQAEQGGDLIVNVTLGGGFLEIFTLTPSTCPPPNPDMPDECEIVCPNTTITYGAETSGDVEWTVNGAENFTVNGANVTVEWGEPGMGEVIATIGGGGQTEPLNIQCGQYQSPQFDDDNGIGYVFVDGGVPPYTYFLSNGQNTGSGTNPFLFEDLPPGTYLVEVVDASGQTAVCDFFIEYNPFCNLAVWGDVTPNGSCDSISFCNASIDISINSAVTGGIFYEWIGPNGFGSQSEDLFNICPGTYTVTVIEGFECAISRTFEVGCLESSCGASDTICVEILEEVEAIIATNPPLVDGEVEICDGQTLFFENLSINAETYLWNFGDNNFSTEFEPEHIFPGPGTYEVSLIARNECFCSDTTSINVVVTATRSPEIDCVGTTCGGETITYTSDSPCSTFNWVVSPNGTVIDGGGTGDNFISVEWNGGVEGIIELSVDGCPGDFCDLPAIFEIPIISSGSVIEGPEKVCNGEIATYTIPDFDGTAINWTVSPFGTIVSGQGTNQLTVEWSGDLPVGPQMVSVTYDNCYLGCSGSDDLVVNVVPEYFMTGEIEICENGSGIYRTQNALNNNPVNSNWTVFAPDGSVFATSSGAMNAFMVDWLGSPGTYTVEAIPANPDDFCNESSLSITVIGAPARALGIAGEDFICPTESYTYSAIASQSGWDFKWYINNGGTISEAEGSPIVVAWGNTPPYSISLAQVSTNGLPCESDTITTNIEAISQFTISGVSEVCEDDVASFSATDFENVFYDWSILPADAGTIATGEGTANIEILWHIAGPATVQLNVCGLTETHPVTVHPKPRPVANHPVGLCEGETVEVTTFNTYDSFTWYDEFGTPFSNDPNPTLGTGYYRVEVTNQFGCVGDSTFHIAPFAMPNARISSPDALLALCPGSADITLYALEEVNGYSYQWFHDNNPVGGNTSTFSTNQPGAYHVEVTDQNGCMAVSNALVIRDCADLGGTCQGSICVIPPGGGGGGGGGCTPNGDILFTVSSTPVCNQSNFTNTSVNDIPNSWVWNFNDPESGADNNSTLENPTHIFTNAGFFRVRLTGNVQDATNPAQGCFDDDIRVATVPAVADFFHTDICAGGTMDFGDLSRFLEGNAIADWAWDFGDPASGTDNNSNLQNPSHIFVTEGFYDVSLTITTDGGCSATYTESVEVFGAPPTNFEPPAQNCQNTALNFVADVPNTVTYVRWDFGDPVSGAANSSELFDTYHTFENTGNYTVTLHTMNIYGCTNSFSRVISITPNGLDGDIFAVPVPPICEGDHTMLAAPAGGTSWSWSTGETAETIIVDEAGVYKVTLTDDEGCSYTPPALVVEIIPAPSGFIRVVEYDEFGQPLNYEYDGYSLCEGEDVHLETVENANYSYSWSLGGDMPAISFTEERGNLLAAGTYDVSVTLTDLNTGCTAIIGGYELIVHPVPADLTISSSPSGTLCANTSTTLNVDSPQANLTYLWNTGETGTSINVFNGGEYYVTAINEFGCRTESNRVEVLEAPNIRNIPTGCHTRCNPDTICLPDMPNVVSYQWFLNGSPIPTPEGTVPDLIATESGDYTLEMVDIFGCMATSDVLSLELFQGFGTISGDVYFDVNDNGIIDGPDTLMSGITIQLLDEMGALINTSASDMNGNYAFPDIPSVVYNLEVDTNSLPMNTGVLMVQAAVELVGCDDMEQVDWLVIPQCPNFEEVVDLSACEGSSIDYEGNTILAGESLVLNLTSTEGCDSTVTINVAALPVDATTLELSSCDGNPIEYESTPIDVGNQMDFTFVNSSGCDSIVTVSVIDASSPTTDLLLEVCEGETVEYNGETLATGDQRSITLQNQYGCDSVIQVNVAAFEVVQFEATSIDCCPNLDNGIVEIINISGGAAPYTFSLDGINFQNSSIFSNLGPNEYEVYLQDGSGCIYTENIIVNTTASLEIDLNDVEFSCDKESVSLHASLVSGNPAEVTWEWQDGSTDSTFTATEVGLYSVQVSNQCENLNLSAEVYRARMEREGYIYVPNIFSPNADNINDEFRGQLAEDSELMEYELFVFDRWGNLLFNTEDIGLGWDGTYQTRAVKPGVYIWTVKAKVISCREEVEVFEKGDVTVMR